MKFLVLVLLAFNLSAAYAECGKDTISGVEYGWCVYPGEGDDVLYYFHGGGGNEDQWSKAGYESDFQKTWSKLGYKSPTVLAFSFGPSWILTDLPGDESLQMVVNQIMPKLEKKIGGVKGVRMAMGPSMGGYNSAEVAMRYPEKFKRAAHLCPGLGYVGVSPFDSQVAIEKFIAEQPATAKPDNVREILGWVAREFKTPENWERHDPQVLAKKLTNKDISFYISCTKDDEYSFFDGAKNVAEILSKKNYVKWVPIESGGHCHETDETMAQMAEFLAGKK